jgi:broad specificity phosphatase PhoE
MRLYLIRHADPDYPNNTITAAGHLEAQALAMRLKLQGLDQIFTSPLGRAMETARYSAEALNLTPIVMPWTTELDWPGLEQEGLGNSTIWDIHGHEVHRTGTAWTWENWCQNPPFHREEYQKGLRSLQVASDAFFSKLGYERTGGVYRVVQAHRKKIAIFCHGGFGLTWLAYLLNIPLPLVWTGFFLPPSSVTTILFDERHALWATPRCLGVGDISHLYAAGLPMQPAGIKANRD